MIFKVNNMDNNKMTCDNINDLINTFVFGDNINSDDEDSLFNHLSECSSCMEYFIAASENESSWKHENNIQTTNEKFNSTYSSFKKILVTIKDAILKPLSEDYLVKNSVYALGDDDQAILYDIPLEMGIIPIRLIASGNNKFSLQIFPKTEYDKFYLIGNGEKRKEFIFSNYIKFDSISPGKYCITENFRDFIIIEVNDK